LSDSLWRFFSAHSMRCRSCRPSMASTASMAVPWPLFQLPVSLLSGLLILGCRSRPSKHRCLPRNQTSGLSSATLNGLR
jgi:hypothetical protein